MTNLLIDWPELYALGFSLIPVRIGEKIPAIQWARFQLQRATMEEIATWQHEGQNAGIVTGAISGIVVLDCDTVEAVRQATALGIPNDTVSAKTAKGVHFYFLHPGFPVPNKVGLLPGMDVRGDGGFVVAPGSVHPSGAVYEWINHPAWHDILPLPGWLLEKIHGQPLSELMTLPTSAQTRTAYGHRAMERELQVLRKAKEGHRNDQLNKSSLALAQLAAGGQIDAREAQAALIGAAIEIGLGIDEIERTLESGWQAGLREPRGPDHTASLNASAICATPFVILAVTDIPPRPWVLGRWLLRRTVATVIAPGGTGKSALMVAAALSLASGRELLGKTVWSGPKHVWLWNLEDDRDELARQIIACSQHHGLSEQDYAGRLFVNDAKSPLCTATKGREGLTIHEPVNAALVAEIHARKIDVLIIDPFVSSHQAEENDNGQINAIAERWANIARETNCSIILVHHSRKLGGQQVDAEAARGASALGNASRSVIVLNRMEKPEATRFGVSDEDRRRYIRVSNDKTNRAPAGEADWYRLIPVRLANGGPEGGDSVGVIERWTPTEISAIFDDTARARIQAEIVSGEWRAQHTAKDWAGRAVAQVLGLDVSNPANKVRVIALLKDMLAKGQLRIENRPDANRKKRDFIIAGEPIVPVCDSPAW